MLVTEPTNFGSPEGSCSILGGLDARQVAVRKNAQDPGWTVVRLTRHKLHTGNLHAEAVQDIRLFICE
ncbi:MAG: hypothetical protein WAV82_03025 [Methylobacter sp.]